MLSLALRSPSRQIAALQRDLVTLPRRVRREVRDVFKAGLNDALAWMIRTHLSAKPAPVGTRSRSKYLARRSGALIAGLATEAALVPEGVRGRLYLRQNSPAAKYGPIHEYGGTIFPVRATYLTVPLVEEATRVRPRQVAGLFFIESKKGNKLLVRRAPGGFLEAMWLLLTSVRIPARPFMKPTAVYWFPRIVRRMRDRVRKELRVRNG